MTHGYAEWLEGQGVHLSDPRPWPLEWITFRLHPCAHRAGIDAYRRRMERGDDSIEPVILCSRCYTVIDGWHRVAAAWRAGRETIMVRFADQHWYGKESCHVELTPWIETLRPWTEMDCVSGGYHRKDFENPLFTKQVRELMDFGDHMPKMRLWEHARALVFLGRVRGREILDVGTRESVVPFYLAQQGARVHCLETKLRNIPRPLEKGMFFQEGDVRDSPFVDNAFDAVLCTAVLKHIPGRGDTKAMKEMVRIARPGGLIAVSFDYAQKYWPIPNDISGRRIYDKATVMSRLVKPIENVAELCGPVDLDRCDWEDWPIKGQSQKVYETGVNLQVAFLLFRKRGGLNEEVAKPETEVDVVEGRPAPTLSHPVPLP